MCYHLLGSCIAKTDVPFLEWYHCILTCCIYDEVVSADAYSFINQTICIHLLVDMLRLESLHCVCVICNGGIIRSLIGGYIYVSSHPKSDFSEYIMQVITEHVSLRLN